MIVIEENKDLLKASVYAEFTLADYQEFERAVTHELASVPKIKLRITSYNVCYTKLLRIALARQDNDAP